VAPPVIAFWPGIIVVGPAGARFIASVKFTIRQILGTVLIPILVVISIWLLVLVLVPVFFRVGKSAPVFPDFVGYPAKEPAFLLIPVLVPVIVTILIIVVTRRFPLPATAAIAVIFGFEMLAIIEHTGGLAFVKIIITLVKPVFVFAAAILVITILVIIKTVIQVIIAGAVVPILRMAGIAVPLLLTPVARPAILILILRLIIAVLIKPVTGVVLAVVTGVVLAVVPAIAVVDIGVAVSAVRIGAIMLLALVTGLRPIVIIATAAVFILRALIAVILSNSFAYSLVFFQMVVPIIVASILIVAHSFLFDSQTF
jgi:hypothetical protein